MSGLFSPSVSIPAPTPLPPSVRQPVPGDDASQAAARRAQNDLMNRQGFYSTDLTGPGEKRGPAPYSGTVLGK